MPRRPHRHLVHACLLAGLASVLSACATSEDTKAGRVADLRMAYDAAHAAVQGYAARPGAKPTIVAALQRADSDALAALDAYAAAPAADSARAQATAATVAALAADVAGAAGGAGGAGGAGPP